MDISTVYARLRDYKDSGNKESALLILRKERLVFSGTRVFEELLAEAAERNHVDVVRAVVKKLLFRNEAVTFPLDELVRSKNLELLEIICRCAVLDSTTCADALRTACDTKEHHLIPFIYHAYNAHKDNGKEARLTFRRAAIGAIIDAHDNGVELLCEINPVEQTPAWFAFEAARTGDPILMRDSLRVVNGHLDVNDINAIFDESWARKKFKICEVLTAFNHEFDHGDEFVAVEAFSDECFTPEQMDHIVSVLRFCPMRHLRAISVPQPFDHLTGNVRSRSVRDAARTALVCRSRMIASTTCIARWYRRIRARRLAAARARLALAASRIYHAPSFRFVTANRVIRKPGRGYVRTMERLSQVSRAGGTARGLGGRPSE